MSTSSEIVDSGRFSGNKTTEKSNFSQTFNFLSQYLKENRTFGDLSLIGIIWICYVVVDASGMATGTMNLFPATNKSSASPVSTQEVPKKHPESAQMTMFYAGQVIVLDDFPAEKAMEIMMLAGKGKTQTFRPASDWSPKPTEPANLAPATHINTEKENVQLQHVDSAFYYCNLQGVYHCGYHSDKSYGASSYLIVHPQGNIFIDSPRYIERLARNIEDMGGAQYMDDVADYKKWSDRLGCKRILHSTEVEDITEDVEMKLDGCGPWSLNDDIQLIHTPGQHDTNRYKSYKRIMSPDP
ncbi:hypothetical protein LXL04_023237 [Taraxacum kok-saghyz]